MSTSLLNKRQFIKRTLIPMKYYEDPNDTWDHGEVAWDFPKNATMYNPNPPMYDKKNPTRFINNSPLLKKIDIDQSNVASLSAILKTTQTEFKNSEMLLYNIQSILESFNNHFIFSPMEIYVFAYLSSIYFGYNKVKEMESIRIERLYRDDKRTNYYKKFERARQTTMVAFIFMSVIFTRNVKMVF
jgi:hypothetical protein